MPFVGVGVLVGAVLLEGMLLFVREVVVLDGGGRTGVERWLILSGMVILARYLLGWNLDGWKP